LQQGWLADLVVFDPETVADTATYESPKSFPVGIRHVLVNGHPAVLDAVSTGTLAGEAIP
jgi:N-acyl-D-amino-acid deacylase